MPMSMLQKYFLLVIYYYNCNGFNCISFLLAKYILSNLHYSGTFDKIKFRAYCTPLPRVPGGLDNRILNVEHSPATHCTDHHPTASRLMLEKIWKRLAGPVRYKDWMWKGEEQANWK